MCSFVIGHRVPPHPSITAHLSLFLYYAYLALVGSCVIGLACMPQEGGLASCIRSANEVRLHT